MTSKSQFPTSSEQYEKLYKIGFNAWKARLRNEPEVEVATKLHNVDSGFDKEVIKAEIAAIEEMSRGQEGFISECQTFFVDNVLWIVCDFEAWSEGTVRDIMSLHSDTGAGVFDEQLVRAIGAQMLGPLEFLHSQGRVFRDLRCKNLLVTPNGEIQLLLYTLPSILQEKAPIYKDSLFWASPELLLQERVPGSSMTPAAAMAAAAAIGPPVDVWALGITLLELALGDPPLSQDLAPVQVFQAIVEGEPPTLPPEIAPLWSKGFKEVIQRCLIKDVNSRATIAELKAHPFFAGAPGADYIKEHLLAPLPPIEQRWKVISQLREQHEVAKQERKEHADRLAQQASQFAQSATELPDFNPSLSSGGPSLVGGGPSLGGGGPSLSNGPSLTSGPSLGGIESTPISSGNSSANSSASTPFSMGAVQGTSQGGMGANAGAVQYALAHVGLANSTSSVPASSFTPRGMVSVSSGITLPTHVSGSMPLPSGPQDNPFLFDAGGSAHVGINPASGLAIANQGMNPSTGANQQSMVMGSANKPGGGSVSVPGPSGASNQEPTRGRFRIVNPGSSTNTPSGSLDLGQHANPQHQQQQQIPYNYNYNGVPFMQADGTYAMQTGPAPVSSAASSSSVPPVQGQLVSRRSARALNGQGSMSSPPQTPSFNVPIEAYLGENERDYIVIFRALPGTMVSLSLEGKVLVLSGQVPPLAPALLKQLHTSERPVSKFERKITFPGEVDPNDFGREIIRETNTMIIRVKKSPKSIHMGDDMF